MLKKFRLALHQRRALNCFVTSEFEKAEHHFQQVQKLNPTAQGIFHNLALVKMAMGKYQEAEQLFLRDIDRYGEYYPRMRALADLYYIWGQGKNAKLWYTKTLEGEVTQASREFIQRRLTILSNPQGLDAAQQSHALYREGTQYEVQKNYEKAVELYQQASVLDPTNVPALNNWGAVLMNHKKDYSTAAELFEKAFMLEQLDWIRHNLTRARQALSQQ